jgi:hypothetical protein
MAFYTFVSNVNWAEFDVVEALIEELLAARRVIV